MPKSRHYPDIPQTCPLINGLIDALSNVNDEDFNATEHIKDLEKIRQYNDQLRTWGAEKNEELESVEKDREYYEDKYNSALKDIEHLEKELAEVLTTTKPFEV